MELKEFLKLYTAIDERFIGEYYKFYEMCNDNIYGINVDIIIDYLKIKKREEFYRRLRDNYKNPDDYIIKIYKQLPLKGIKNKDYYVTIDTFEKICMSTKSEKGKSVRDYFVILRKFIQYYKNNIDKMIRNEINNNKLCVYILLVDKGNDFHKIGKSENFRERLYQYSTGMLRHPDVKFIMLVDDQHEVENCVKVFLKDYQYKKKKFIK